MKPSPLSCVTTLCFTLCFPNLLLYPKTFFNAVELLNAWHVTYSKFKFTNDQHRAQYLIFKNQLFDAASRNIHIIISHFTANEIDHTLDITYKEPAAVLMEVHDILKTAIDTILFLLPAKREVPLRAIFSIPRIETVSRIQKTPLEKKFKESFNELRMRVIYIYDEMKKDEVAGSLSKSFVQEISELRKEKRSSSIKWN